MWCSGYMRSLILYVFELPFHVFSELESDVLRQIYGLVKTAVLTHDQRYVATWSVVSTVLPGATLVN